MTIGAADPDRVTLRHAARVLCVGVVVFVGLGWVADQREAAPAGMLAVYTLGAQADFGGSLARRARRYLLSAALSVITIPFVALLADWPVVIVALTGLVVFTTMFLAALGGPFYSARFPIVVAFLLSATATATPAASTTDAVLERTLGWTIGCAAITVAAVVLWPSRAPSPVPALTADLWRRVARALATPPRAAARADLLDASRRLRVAANGAHLHPGALAVDERRWSEVVHATERLAAATGLLDPGRAPADQELLDATAGALRAAADDLDAGRDATVASPPLFAPRVSSALDDHGAALAAALAEMVERGRGVEAEASALVRDQVASADARAVARCADVALALADDLRGAGGIGGDALVAGEAAADQPDAALRAQLRLRSLWFRNALRAAVALMVAVLLVLEGVGQDHGFWVTLGAFAALRHDFGTARRSARHAVVGTTIGFVVSSLIVVADVDALTWIGYAVALFVAASGARLRPEVGTASFTVMVVLLYTLAEPAGLRTGETRLVNVVVGIAVTLAVTLLLWPRAGRTPGRVTGEVVDAARRALAAAVSGAAGAAPTDSPPRLSTSHASGPASPAPPPAPAEVVTDLDRVLDVLATSAPQAFDDRERARIVLIVTLAAQVADRLRDPRAAPVPLGAAARDPELWTSLAADATRVDGALRAGIGRLATEPARPIPPEPRAVVTWVTARLVSGPPVDPPALSAGIRTAAALGTVHRVATELATSRAPWVRRSGSTGDDDAAETVGANGQPTRTGTFE